MPLVDTVEVTLIARGKTYNARITNADANSLIEALDVATKHHAELERYIQQDAANQERLRKQRAKGRRRSDNEPEGD